MRLVDMTEVSDRQTRLEVTRGLLYLCQGRVLCSHGDDDGDDNGDDDDDGGGGGDGDDDDNGDDDDDTGDDDDDDDGDVDDVGVVTRPHQRRPGLRRRF